MCLQSKQREPYIAHKDIKVYKVALFNKKNGKFYSPYMGSQLCCKAAGKTTMRPYVNADETIYQITEGYIHAFYEKREAITIAENFYHNSYREAVKKYIREGILSVTVIQGYIPKGTKYYVGAYHPEICAEYIQFDERYVL